MGLARRRALADTTAVGREGELDALPNAAPLTPCPEGATWRTLMCLDGDWGGTISKDCPQIPGLSLAINTPRIKGEWQPQKASYFAHDTEFETLNEALAVLGFAPPVRSQETDAARPRAPKPRTKHKAPARPK